MIGWRMDKLDFFLCIQNANRLHLLVWDSFTMKSGGRHKARTLYTGKEWIHISIALASIPNSHTVLDHCWAFFIWQKVFVLQHLFSTQKYYNTHNYVYFFDKDPSQQLARSATRSWLNIRAMLSVGPRSNIFRPHYPTSSAGSLRMNDRSLIIGYNITLYGFDFYPSGFIFRPQYPTTLNS